jgi:hypothetical protein
MKYRVIKDTREKFGSWVFSPSANCLGMEIRGLRTGDYTIEGYEDKLTVERKANTAEFCTNINEGRFERELKRMESFAHPFMILEFEAEDIINFPVNSGIPKEKWGELKVTPWYMLKRLTEFQIEYKTQIILAGKRGKVIAASIFKRVLEKYYEN